MDTVTRYTVDGVALARYLVDALPSDADDAFRRAEQGVDVLEAPTVTIGEAIWATVNKNEIGGKSVETTPNAVLRGLVHDGPVVVAETDEQELAVAGSLLGHHTLHDALLIASHRVQGTEAIVTNDEQFGNETTVWE